MGETVEKSGKITSFSEFLHCRSKSRNCHCTDVPDTGTRRSFKRVQWREREVPEAVTNGRSGVELQAVRIGYAWLYGWNVRHSYFRMTEESANAVKVSRTPGISAICCQICRIRSAFSASTRTRRSKSPVMTSHATTSGIFLRA